MSSMDPVPLISTLTRRLHLSIRRSLYEDVTRAGYADLAPAHLYVFQLPGPDGVRPTELAARMNATKQATNHLLRELEERGYLTRVASSADGRAKVVRLTARGIRVMKIMRDSSLAIEGSLAARIGAARLETLRAGLARMADSLDP